MKKRMLSLALATAMLAGASMTVFAAEPVEITALPEEGTDIEMEGTVKTATIKVTVTQGGDIIANPYGLAIENIDADGENTLEGSTIKFKNESDTAIEIGLKGAITLSDGNAAKAKAAQVSIASDAKTIASSTTKQIYVQAEVVDAVDADGKVTDSSVYLADAKGKAVAPLVYQAKAAAIATNPVLAKKSYDTSGDDAVASAKEEMVVVITGATSVSATSPWDDTDKFKVTTTYDLKLAKVPSAFVAKA